MKKKLPYSLRKYLRREKARIKKTAKDASDLKRALEELYSRVNKE